MVTAAAASFWNPCSWAIVKEVCGAAGSAAQAVGGFALDTILRPLADAVGTVLRALMTFWLKVPTPDFADPSGPVAHLQHLNLWITGVVGFVGLLIGAARLGWSRDGYTGRQMLHGMLALALCGAAVPIVTQTALFLDDYGQWVLSNGSTGFDDRAGLFIEGFAHMGPGLVLSLAIPIILSSVAQIILLIVRVGVLTIMLGVLPIVAASSVTESGAHALRRLGGWILAFLLYGPLAATIYAAAFLMVGTGKDVTSVLAGMATIFLALAALPALLRAVQPVMAAVTYSGGGGGMAGAAAAAATGARMVSSSTPPERSSSSSQGPTGAGPAGSNGSSGGNGSAGHSGAAGGNGASGAAGSAGSSGAAGASGGAGTAAAGAAGGPVGAGVTAAAQAASGAKKAAESSVPSGNGSDIGHASSGENH